MEIVKIVDNLPELVKLRVGHPDCSKISDNQLKAECVKIIARSFIYGSPNGQPSPQILEHQSSELLGILRKGFKTLTIPEVQQAFKNGLDGLYGPYYGMCGKTYTQFLKGYIDNPERGKAWGEYMDKLEKPKTMEVPEHIKVQTTKENIIKRFKTYKETGDIGFCAFAAHDTLVEWKGVEFTDAKGRTFKTLCTDQQVRAKIWKDTQDKFIKDLMHMKAMNERSGKFDEAKSIGNQIANGVDKLATIHLKQKEALVKWYFDSVDEL